MACSQHKSDLLKEFSLGNLKGEELDMVLAHLEDCEACSEELEVLASITTLAALRGESLLEEEETTVYESGLPSPISRFLASLERLFRPVPLPVRVLVPAAAVFIVFFVLTTDTRRNGGFSSIADLTPATYVQVALRGDSEAEEDPFTGAMEFYESGDFEEAARRLLVLSEAREENEKILFYLGVSLLLSGESEKAARYLEKTALSASAGMRQRSIWYLAQADILGGNPAKAKERLLSLVAEDGEMSRRARTQLDAIEEALVE